MTVRLIREPSVDGTTLGVVFVDDRFFCFSLEDEIREQHGKPVESWKVAGKTAIPAGSYPIAWTFSPRFKRKTPELQGVKGFTGIRIHPGNRSTDTEGCPLFGYQRAEKAIALSRAACNDFEAMLLAALGRGESAWMHIENPQSFRG